MNLKMKLGTMVLAGVLAGCGAQETKTSVPTAPTPTPSPAYDIGQGWSLGTIKNVGYNLWAVEPVPSRRTIALGDVVAETMLGPDARVRYQGMASDGTGKRAIFTHACTYGGYDAVTRTSDAYAVAEGGFLKIDLVCPAMNHGISAPLQKLELRLGSFNERGDVTIDAKITTDIEQRNQK